MLCDFVVIIILDVHTMYQYATMSTYSHDDHEKNNSRVPMGMVCHLAALWTTRALLILLLLLLLKIIIIIIIIIIDSVLQY